MARDIDRPGSSLAAEFDVGGDDDLPGLGQPYTADDIDAILSSSRGTTEEKRELLLKIRNDLEVRSSMDMEDDAASLFRRIDDALATLAAPGDGYGTPSAYGMDPQTRTSQPDEELERLEEFLADEDGGDEGQRS